MKIFWYSNVLFPDACDHLNIKHGNGCGWQLAYAQELLLHFPNCTLAVSGIYQGKKVQSFFKDHITYYLIPCSKPMKYSSCLKNIWKEVLEDFKPDIIHLHGTEYPAGYSLLEAAGQTPVVASIQGLVSIISRYYLGGMTLSEIILSVALRDLIRPSQTFLPIAARNMTKRGVLENKSIKQLKHIIGRTGWDYVHATTQNPEINYHFCNESLRPPFYLSEHWNYSKCRRHSVFAGSSAYPIKGAHQLIRAFSVVIRSYPDAILRIVGMDVVSPKTVKDWIRLTGYALFLRRLVFMYHLENNVHFLGTLDTNQMIHEFLQCNCYVLPSAIENSPNTLGEAQLLGVPCIGSYVGGVPDMIDDGITGYLYRYEETEELAAKICRIFSQAEQAQTMGTAAAHVAAERHNRQKNAETLMSIYRSVTEKNNN